MNATQLRLLAISVLFCCSCQALRDYRTYRRVVAHEREYADVSIARHELAVELEPEQHRAHIHARPLFANHGDEPVERVQVLLADGVDLAPLRANGIELEHRTEAVALGGFRATLVEVAGFPPIAPGGELAIDFDYTLVAREPNMALRLEPTDGYLLLESMWVPTLRTPLSEVGMERAPLAIEVSLPEPLVPLGLPDFQRVDEGGRTTYRGVTEFPFSPFLVYGEYAEHARGGVRVLTLAGDELPQRAIDFLLDAAGELRARYERWFGPIDLPATRVVAVRRYGGSWGAPACLLLDEAGLPRETWREQSAYMLAAHEFAHTWWGTAVALHGRTGYLHEGLANWCSARSVGERYGAEAEERAYETWLVRYARGEEPLGEPLGEISILDGDVWQRGAYLVGAHFYRALAEQLGEERFLAALQQLFAEHAFASADFDDLRAVLGADSDPEIERFLDRWLASSRGGDELYRRGRELVETRTKAWREREPAPSAELQEDVRERLERALASLEGADLASGSADERWALLAERIGPVNDLPRVQITAIDAQADVVYHAGGVHGSVLGHRDVRGRSVYGAIVESSAGELANFDFLSDDLRAGRENAVAWRELDGLWLVVEGHEWRALDPLP